MRFAATGKRMRRTDDFQRRAWPTNVVKRSLVFLTADRCALSPVARQRKPVFRQIRICPHPITSRKVFAATDEPVRSRWRGRRTRMRVVCTQWGERVAGRRRFEPGTTDQRMERLRTTAGLGAGWKKGGSVRIRKMRWNCGCEIGLRKIAGVDDTAAPVDGKPRWSQDRKRLLCFDFAKKRFHISVRTGIAKTRKWYG